ncbi:MAG: hypothetical protein JNK76_14190, partial [Planctomycetales bacterium]|nr:hypothetical protein [Planctomycetales bacterium]
MPSVTLRTLYVFALLFVSSHAVNGAEPAKLRPAAEAWPDVFVYTDTCNTYVLRDGDAAILINLGDAGVLEHLAEIGVRRVEWILFTDHHREQCQGIGRVDRAVTKIAAPLQEQ